MVHAWKVSGDSCAPSAGFSAFSMDCGSPVLLTSSMSVRFVVENAIKVSSLSAVRSVFLVAVPEQRSPAHLAL